MTTETQSWNILGDFFRKYGFVHHQTSSFNKYLDTDIPRIILEEPDIIISQKEGHKYTVKFGEVYIPFPTIIEDNVPRICFPSETRQTDLTYESPIHVDITEIFEENGSVSEVIMHKRAKIGYTPIMLRSDRCNLLNCTPAERIEKGECAWDQGGYFIIRGKERVLASQIRGVYNQPLVLTQKPNDKYKYICEIRSMSEETGHSVLVQAKITNDDRNIVFSLPYIKEPIPAGIVFKALGYIDKDEILNLIGIEGEQVEKYLKLIIRDSCSITDQNSALNYIGQFAMHIIKENVPYSWQVVETEMFPHLGVTATIKEKAFFLGYMIKKLLSTHIGLRMDDDRDNWVNKRVETAGILCGDLFRTLFKKYIITIKTTLESKKQRLDIMAVISHNSHITMGLRHSFATGNWGVQKSYMRTGVSQVLSRLTFGASLSHCRRMVIPIGKEGKNAKIRQINPSQIMYICPSECFDPETPILLWNGKVVKAHEVVIGDVLIDDSGNPTRVRSTCSGITNMYEVQQDGTGLNYTVTDNHILTLKIKNYMTLTGQTDCYHLTWFDKKTLCYLSKNFESLEESYYFINDLPDDILDIQIQDYLKLPDDIKQNLHGFKCESINWEKQDVQFDPYILGLWLGDGNKTDTKEIPYEYITNNRETRLAIFAGLIDSVGCTNRNRNIYRLPFVNNKVREQLSVLAGSLGFLIYNKDNFFYMTGKFLHEIPSIIYGKDIDPKAVYSSLLTCINVVEKDVGEFVGWQLEGNGRFLLGDCTVVHNTPEGQSIGIVLNMALSTMVTHRVPSVLVKEILETSEYLIQLSDFEGKNDKTKVFLNGIMIGMVEDADDFVEEIKIFREVGLLVKEISITYDVVNEEVKIFSDEGRLIRPLFAVEDGKVKITEEDGTDWDELVDKQLIKYLDNSEIENCAISMFQDDLTKNHYDYCEISPAMMLGVMASIIPFPDHSQSPRNCYQCLDPDELVVMSNGDKKKIKDVSIGDQVITVDPVTYNQSITTVTNQYVRPTNKKIITITTISGRVITCTEDHPVLSPNGWVKAIDVEYIGVVLQNGETVEDEYNRFDNSNFQNTIVVRDNIIFVPVKSHVEKSIGGLIADISVESENHSFIAGDSFCVHNSSMGKQAIGMFATSYQVRTDTIAHVLDYPQRPLVSTKPSQFMGFNDMPSGINAIVAICCYSGLTLVKPLSCQKHGKSASQRATFPNCGELLIFNYQTIREIS